MSGNEFEETVLCSLELILETLTKPKDLEKGYLEKITSLQKAINELEIGLKKEKSNSFILKAENDELSEELKGIHLELEKLKSLNDALEKKINSISLEEKKNLSSDDNLVIPEKLLENSEFSLEKNLKEGKTKEKVVYIFKKFIVILSLEIFDGELQDVVEFLDVESSFTSSPLFKSASKEWRESLHFETILLKISEELEKIPAKNRYNILIEKFEKMIS